MDIDSTILGVVLPLILLIYALVLAKELKVKAFRQRIRELEIELSDALEKIFELENENFGGGKS